MSATPPPLPGLSAPPPMPPVRPAKSGFPLILVWIIVGLFVVIGGISFVTAVFFTGSSIAMKKARKLQAANMAAALELAVNAYYIEYGHLPDSRYQQTPGDFVVDTSEPDGAVLVTILTGRELRPGDNPRQIAFLTVPTAKAGKGGLVIDGSDTPKLHDPWGKGFKVLIDHDGNESMSPPSESGSVTELRGRRAAAYSLGASGKGGAEASRSW